MSSSHTDHRSAFEQQAAYLASRPEFAPSLPAVILTTTHPASRKAPPIRRHLELPAAPRRTPSIIDAETLQPVDPTVPPGLVRERWGIGPAQIWATPHVRDVVTETGEDSDEARRTIYAALVDAGARDDDKEVT
jgi:hypothetical protein